MKPGLHWSLAPEVHAKKVAPHIHPNLDQKSLGSTSSRPSCSRSASPTTASPSARLARAGRGVDPQPHETKDDLGAVGYDELNESVAHVAQT
ncbi:MAG: hypothetical protein H6720_21450 [Sandaracinus sp.]|nr:hypothetical protein [Sandaracinus sp.]